MKIIDANIEDVIRKPNRRERSSETQELMDAVSSLQRGQAVAILVDEEEEGMRMRSRLKYAAKLVKKRLLVEYDEGKVIFALKVRPYRRRTETDTSG